YVIKARFTDGRSDILTKVKKKTGVDSVLSHAHKDDF
ncbi:unnamed protein product, partial [marine sediment metagenome]